LFDARANPMDRLVHRRYVYRTGKEFNAMHDGFSE
jgi:hypothetical protein